MKWTKNGKYAIQSGEWTICKVSANSEWRYGLYRGDKIVGWYATSGTAKEAIKEAVNGSICNAD